jgi:hypothetical protein
VIEHRGGCACNAVRYRASGKPTVVSHCHCGMCRRASGALFVTFATFPAERFEWTKGEPIERRSSPRALRAFCGACGTQLTWRQAEGGTTVDVTVGSMDHPNNFPAADHIWTSSQVTWLHVQDDLPHHERERE